MCTRRCSPSRRRRQRVRCSTSSRRATSSASVSSGPPGSSSPRRPRRRSPRAMPESLYDTLGVKKGAAPDEIKKAYRKLARQYHPDTNQEKDAEERFKQVQTAYDVLSDSEKRKAYDRFGSTNGRGRPGPGGGNVDFGDFDWSGDLGDILGGIFGNVRGGARRARPQPVRGADVEAEVSL